MVERVGVIVLRNADKKRRGERDRSAPRSIARTERNARRRDGARGNRGPPEVTSCASGTPTTGRSATRTSRWSIGAGCAALDACAAVARSQHGRRYPERAREPPKEKYLKEPTRRRPEARSGLQILPFFGSLACESSDGIRAARQRGANPRFFTLWL